MAELVWALSADTGTGAEAYSRNLEPNIDRKDRLQKKNITRGKLMAVTPKHLVVRSDRHRRTVPRYNPEINVLLAI